MIEKLMAFEWTRGEASESHSSASLARREDKGCERLTSRIATATLQTALTLQSESPPAIGTDEDYECLEKAAGIKSPNNAFRHGIAHCLKLWLNRPNDLLSARPAASQKALRKISADASRLLEDIANPNADEKEAWAYEYAIIELGLEGSEITEKLRGLIETADALLAPEDKGGRPIDFAFEYLIERLASVYEQAKKRPAGVSHNRTGGPFFRLVRECRDRFDLRLRRQDDALGKAIYRCLQKRRKRQRQDKT
jgi:hypothetical protein